MAETTRLRGLGHDLQVSGEALEFLVREGFHRNSGRGPAEDGRTPAAERSGEEIYAKGVVRGRVLPDLSGAGWSSTPIIGDP